MRLWGKMCPERSEKSGFACFSLQKNCVGDLPDNDDFYQERGNRLKMGHRDLLEHLRDKDRRYYYDHVLVPMPNTTLKDFI